MIAMTTANSRSLLRRVSLGIDGPRRRPAAIAASARIVKVPEAVPQARPEVSLTVSVTGISPAVESV